MDFTARFSYIGIFVAISSLSTTGCKSRSFHTIEETSAIATGTFNDFASLKKTLAGTKPPIDVEGLLPALHPSLRQNAVFVFSTRSMLRASHERPRVILFSDDGSFLFSYQSDPSGAFGQTVEILHQDSTDRMFRAARLQFVAGSGAKLEENPTNCAACHSSQNRPIWDAYPRWPGVYGSRHYAGGAGMDHSDNNYEGTVELQKWKALLTELGLGKGPLAGARRLARKRDRTNLRLDVLDWEHLPTYMVERTRKNDAFGSKLTRANLGAIKAEVKNAAPAAVRKALATIDPKVTVTDAEAREIAIAALQTASRTSARGGDAFEKSEAAMTPSAKRSFYLAAHQEYKRVLDAMRARVVEYEQIDVPERMEKTLSSDYARNDGKKALKAEELRNVTFDLTEQSHSRGSAHFLAVGNLLGIDTRFWSLARFGAENPPQTPFPGVPGFGGEKLTLAPVQAVFQTGANLEIEFDDTFYTY